MIDQTRPYHRTHKVFGKVLLLLLLRRGLFVFPLWCFLAGVTSCMFPGPPALPLSFFLAQVSWPAFIPFLVQGCQNYIFLSAVALLHAVPPCGVGKSSAVLCCQSAWYVHVGWQGALESPRSVLFCDLSEFLLSFALLWVRQQSIFWLKEKKKKEKSFLSNFKLIICWKSSGSF